jgi:hypothetical protein
MPKLRRDTHDIIIRQTPAAQIQAARMSTPLDRTPRNRPLLVSTASSTGPNLHFGPIGRRTICHIQALIPKDLNRRPGDGLALRSRASRGAVFDLD